MAHWVAIATLTVACAPPAEDTVGAVSDGEDSASPSVSYSRSSRPVRTAPTPYAVGSTTIFIHDTGRGFDHVAGIDDGARTLITEIWYPVAHDEVREDAPRATYGDYVFGDAHVHRLMMTATTFFHLTPDTVVDGVDQAQIDNAIAELFLRERGSLTDAPLAQGDVPWPVLLMSHGDAGSRYNMQTTSEHLAAHGYVVAAPEHTGNTPFAQVGRDPLLDDDNPDTDLLAHRDLVDTLTDEHGVYGSAETYGQSYIPMSDGDGLPALMRLDASLVERVDDLRAALAWLEHQNAQGPYAGRFDLDEVGVLGRSFGGATTLVALGLEPRFSAGFAVVPPSLPDVRATLPPEALISDRESALFAADHPNPLTSLSKPTFLLSGGEDALIIGLSKSRAAAFGGDQPTPANPHPVLRDLFETTTQPVVWGLLANTNHGSLAVAGPYWWPALKPRTLPRSFDTASTYTLIDAERAHDIQKTMALAFFDFFMEHNPHAQKHLTENTFTQDGLELETRNLDHFSPLEHVEPGNE
jgi:dienelactone hydrolase